MCTALCEQPVLEKDMGHYLSFMGSSATRSDGQKLTKKLPTKSLTKIFLLDYHNKICNYLYFMIVL